MWKRLPFISIIIYFNNDLELLKKSIESFKKLENCEIIIINSKNDEKTYNLIEKHLNEIDDLRIIYYQSDYKLNKNKSRNIGINLSTGYWLFFINEGDIATKSFISFLNNSRLDIRMHFYRLQVYTYKNKKIKYNYFNQKNFSNELSTFLINGEWINKIGLKFEDHLNIDETLPFIKKIYNFKNVNYKNLKRIYSVKQYRNKNLWNYENIEQEIFKTFHFLLNKKERKYKRYILILMNDIYVNLCKQNKTKFLRILKLMKKQTKFHIFDYFKMGLKFWIKSMKWRTLILFELNNKKNN